MKKIVIITFSFFSVLALKAQQDSTKKIRFSGFQLDIGPGIYPEFNQQTQADYKKVIKNDPYLNADLSGYTKNMWYKQYTRFNGLGGFKLYADLNDGKKIKKELFIGLKYAQEGNSGVYYTKTSYDTVATYVDLSTGKKVYEVSKFENGYDYGISCQKLILPFGINFTTDKQRAFWITYGLEIAPALNFNYVFTSNNSASYTKMILSERDSLNSPTNYVKNGYGTGGGSRLEKKTKLDGVALGFAVALPFTVYLHPFKKAAFYKHLNLLASVSPVYMYSQSKYSGSSSLFTLSVATGIRYNW